MIRFFLAVSYGLFLILKRAVEDSTKNTGQAEKGASRMLAMFYFLA